MEVRSPGNLLSSIPLTTLRELKGNHESRNALVARTLKEIGYVREMGDLAQALSGLYAALSALGPALTFDSAYIRQVLTALPSNNPYHTNAIELVKTLRLLSLMDDARSPTRITLNIWSQSTDRLSSGASTNVPAIRRISHTTRVEPQRSTRNSRLHAGDKNQNVDLFIGNLDYDVTSEDIQKLFESYTHLVSVKIPPDFVTGRGRGFAFAKMSDRSEAALATDDLKDRTIRGRRVRVSWSK